MIEILAGDREAAKRDLPRGGEAQCPLCWRMFTSDAACERHKPYRRLTRNGATSPVCRIPLTVGLRPLSRRGLVIWSMGDERTPPRRHHAD